jgi:hypothetical protein
MGWLCRRFYPYGVEREHIFKKKRELAPFVGQRVLKQSADEIRT